MGKVVGIDLGTTFSAVAHVDEHGQPEIIPNAESDRMTPSVVMFEEALVTVGKIAKQNARAVPEQIIEFAKREMGKSKETFFRTFDDKNYSPEELSALVLTKLKQDAEAYLNTEITDAVITVPAYFRDAEREATRNAGKTEEQWRMLLNEARDTLIDSKRRREHINALEHDEDDIPVEENVDTIFKSPDIPETTIQELSHNGVTSDVDAPVDMVFIPAGEFRMGSRDEKANDNEKPGHTVYVDAFYMDKYLVTNAQYKAFLDASPQWQKDNILTDYHNGNYLRTWNGNNYPKDKANHPVVYVSWYAAMAYAQWVEKRLPTEAEWEKAARGGLTGKKYPWGDQIDATKANYGENIGQTTPIGEYPPNDYGLYNIVGNVWEWCVDEHILDFYATSPYQNPIAGSDINHVLDNFTTLKTYRVLRGGSWMSIPRYVRVAPRFRFSPAHSIYNVGFRCIRTVPL